MEETKRMVPIFLIYWCKINSICWICISIMKEKILLKGNFLLEQEGERLFVKLYKKYNPIFDSL